MRSPSCILGHQSKGHRATPNKLLGGKDNRLRLYASSGEVKSPGARRNEAEARLAEGFDTLKIRVHDWDERVDIAHIQDISLAMQGRMHIAVDNGGTSVVLHSVCDLCNNAGATAFLWQQSSPSLARIARGGGMGWGQGFYRREMLICFGFSSRD